MTEWQKGGKKALDSQMLPQPQIWGGKKKVYILNMYMCLYVDTYTYM